MKQISISPFCEFASDPKRRTTREVSKMLARTYASVLEDPIPPALQRLLEKLDVSRGSFTEANVAAY